MTIRLPRRRTGRDPSSLLARAAGDPEALAEFYEQHAESVLVFFVRRVMDVEVSLDLMSETFAVVLEKCESFRGNTPEEETGWLYAIARSQLSRYWRSGKVERQGLKRLHLDPAHLTDPEIERVEQLADIASMAGRVNGSVVDLPVEQQEALRLRVVEQLDYPEVAAAMGVSEQTARARVSRGLRALAEDLESPDVVEGMA